MPARTPTGVPISVARETSIRLPTMALSNPPSPPGGGVISVNSRNDRPARPRSRVVQSIHTSQNRPKPMASSDMPSARRLTSLRRSCRLIASPPFIPRQTQQQQLRQAQHDEGNEEQDQTEYDQRGRVERRLGLGEFVGQRRGDAVAWLEQRDASEDVDVADQEGHGHGLAQRPSEPEHDAADDADLSVGKDHAPDDLPGRRAEGIG